MPKVIFKTKVGWLCYKNCCKKLRPWVKQLHFTLSLKSIIFLKKKTYPETFGRPLTPCPPFSKFLYFWCFFRDDLPMSSVWKHCENAGSAARQFVGQNCCSMPVHNSNKQTNSVAVRHGSCDNISRIIRNLICNRVTKLIKENVKWKQEQAVKDFRQLFWCFCIDLYQNPVKDEGGKWWGHQSYTPELAVSVKILDEDGGDTMEDGLGDAIELVGAN